MRQDLTRAQKARQVDAQQKVVLYNEQASVAQMLDPLLAHGEPSRDNKCPRCTRLPSLHTWGQTRNLISVQHGGIMLYG